MARKKSLISVFVVAFMIFGVGIIPSSAKPYYQGKDITVLVGFNAGGGTDTTARIFTKYIGKYIPGNPDVIVKNMPGSGGAKALNIIAEKTRPDGLTIIFQNWIPISQLIKEPGIRFDYNKLTLIGGSQGPPFMLFARQDMVDGGIKDSADIMKAPKMVYAGLRPSIPLDLFGRLSLDVLGAEYRYVTGYRGAAKVRAAIKQGQANITTHALTGYRSGVEPAMGKDGTVVPLWYFQSKDDNGNYVKDSSIQDMPSFMEVYNAVHNKAPSGELWEAFSMVRDFYSSASWFFWGPPKMKSEAAEALRTGFYNLMEDKDFKADMIRTLGFEFKATSTEALQDLLDNFKKADSKNIEYLKQFVASGAKK